MTTPHHSKTTTDLMRTTLREDPDLLYKEGLPLTRAVSFLGTHKVVGIVNAGFNDFSVNDDDVCLSLIMAGKFLAITEALKTMESPSYRVERGSILKNRLLYQSLQNDLGDVLYIYKKLKADPKGLNWPLLNAYHEKYPDAQIPVLLNKMDKYQIATKTKTPQFFAKAKGRNA